MTANYQQLSSLGFYKTKIISDLFGKYLKMVFSGRRQKMVCIQSLFGSSDYTYASGLESSIKRVSTSTRSEYFSLIYLLRGLRLLLIIKILRQGNAANPSVKRLFLCVFKFLKMYVLIVC